MFKIKDGYKLELKMPETIKLFGSTKKSIGKAKSGENVPSLEVVLIQWILADNQFQQYYTLLYLINLMLMY